MGEVLSGLYLHITHAGSERPACAPPEMAVCPSMKTDRSISF